MDTDNSMLTSSGNASSLNMTPTWLKNELQEAVNVNNKQVIKHNRHIITQYALVLKS